MNKTKKPRASTKETNNHQKTLESRPRPKNDAARRDDPMKLRIDGLSGQVTPRVIRGILCRVRESVAGENRVGLRWQPCGVRRVSRATRI